MEKDVLGMLSKKELQVLQGIKQGLDTSEKIKQSLSLSDVEVSKSLMFLEDKGIIKKEKQIIYTVKLTEFGKKYLQIGFPEEIVIKVLQEKQEIAVEELLAACAPLLSVEEVQGAIGRLKRAGIIAVEQGKVKLTGNVEPFLQKLKELRAALAQLAGATLTSAELDQYKQVLEQLKERKCIDVEQRTFFVIVLTDLGKEIIEKLEELLAEDFIEQLTPEIILSGEWKKKRFRKYDVTSPVPKIHGGSFHHFRELIDKIKEIFISLGFKETHGYWIETAFWNFDVMFQPQDHPAREQHDTFYLQGKGRLPRVEIVARVAEEHEVSYHYSWDHEVAKQLVLRTHTTAVSFRTLARALLVPPARYFCIGRVFRNEATDAKHLPEFHQVDGIIVEEDANFRELLGIIKEFYIKLGIEVRFMPSYFPFTEPSVQVMARHGTLGWVEMGGAGIFRKECLRPLGIDYPVLAFGLGLERLAMFVYGIDDIRKVFGNYVDLDYIRKHQVKLW
ncbi:MAG: phenylalanine--tRNA ligase subunit alpha [bacterium]|nr:phenylalanine--tRNA ligase subunit alpha [bacterium]